MKVPVDAKDAASFIADVFDVLFKSLAVMLVVPSLALWVYLNRLGWGSLFLEAVLSVNGLWGLLLWTSMALLAFFITVCAPSWILTLLGSSAASGPLVPPRFIVRVVCFSVLWIWALLFGAAALGLHSLSLILGIAAVGDFLCLLFCFDPSTRWSKKCSKLPAMSVFVFAAAIWFASIFVLLPYTYLRSFFGHVDGAGQIVALILCAFLVGLAGYLPGILVYRSQIKKIPPFKQVTNAGIGFAFAALALVVLPALLAPKFPWVFLETLDVYSVEPKEFMVIEEKVLSSLRAISPASSSSSTTVKAFSRFSFGDVWLLCKDPYLPYDPERAGFGAADENAARESSRRAGNNCVALKRDDVREIK